MTYLLVPPARILRLDQQGQDQIDDGREASDDLIRLALRFGSSCDQGILIDEIMLDDVDRGSELRHTDDQSNLARAVVRERDTDRLEEARPGWTKRRDHSDVKVDRAIDVLTDELDERAAETLKAPLDADLLVAWRNRGGRVPDPT